jgi:hypothetical protein
LEKALLSDTGRTEACAKAERDRLDGKLLQIRRRLDQAYLDKLDGKISEAFWESKYAEWTQDQQGILVALQALKLPSPDGLLNGLRILELANRAYSLYLAKPPAEKAKLLRLVLSNCKLDSVSVYPTYRKPFDLIFKRVQSKEWLPREDSNLKNLI